MLCHVLKWKHCDPSTHSVDATKVQFRSCFFSTEITEAYPRTLPQRPQVAEHNLPFNDRIPNATQLANIWDLNALDIALYDFAVEMNVRQMSKYQITLPKWEKYALPKKYYENKYS